MNNIFGTLHPFYEGGPINGRKMANAGFMDALLEQDPFDAYHFFVGNTQSLQNFLEERGQLAAVRRGAVHALPRTDLVPRLRQGGYRVFHFSDPIGDFVRLAVLRNAYAPELFPITCVTHSINYQHYASAFLAHIWGGCSPQDALGTNSHAAKQVIESYFGLLREGYALDTQLCPQPQVRVQCMGVPESAFYDREAAPVCQGGQAMRQRLRLQPDTCLLLLFGRISLGDKMDVQPLLLALRDLREQQKELDVQLVISGFSEQNDNACDYLHAVARLLDVPLHILPNPSDADKAALFAAADVFVSPSDNIQETFGLSLVEAAAAALPTIASDWDGYRDIILDGHTGLLVPTLAPAATEELDMMMVSLFDNQNQYLRSQQTVVSVPALTAAIARLAADPAARRRMGQQAQVHARGFTWAAVVRRWCDFWQELQAIPIDAALEARLRTARHPLHLPFGSIFAPYASAPAMPQLCVLCTDFGMQIRKKQYPMEIAGKLPATLSEDDVRQALTLARKAIRLDELCARLPHTAEHNQATVLWALKHGLLREAQA